LAAEKSQVLNLEQIIACKNSVQNISKCYSISKLYLFHAYSRTVVAMGVGSGGRMVPLDFHT